MQRNGIIEIKTINEAKEAWEHFFGRFFSSDIPEGVDVRFDPALRQFKPRADKGAKYTKPFSEHKKSDHSDDFDDFLNELTIKIPENAVLTQEMLDLTEQAIAQGNFASPVFQTKEHVFYIVWLFKQNKITRQQTSTLLARAQIRPDYPITRTFAILDAEGNFSEEANRILLPLLKQYSWGGTLTDSCLERFRLLIQAAPPSEQIFYLSKADPQIISPEGKQLGNAMLRNKGWYQFEAHDVHFSFGMIDALQIARVGCYRACAPRIKIGPVSINSVKEGVLHNFRPTAISIENCGIKPTTENVHNYKFTPMPLVTAHDLYHIKLHNTIPPEFHMLLNHLTEIISQHTKRDWSTSLWELVDREYYLFKRQAPVTNPSIKQTTLQFAALFSQMIRGMVFRAHPFFLAEELTDEGIAVIRHMLSHSEVWRKIYKVDIRSLPSPYKEQLIKMQNFLGVVGAEATPEIFNLKYRYYCTLSRADYDRMSAVIDNLSPAYKEGFKFDKLGNQHCEYKNHTVLKLMNPLPSGCSLTFLSRQPSTEEKTSARENETPILIKQGDQFRIYGRVNFQWRERIITTSENLYLDALFNMHDGLTVPARTTQLLSILSQGHTTYSSPIKESTVKTFSSLLIDQALASESRVDYALITTEVIKMAAHFKSDPLNLPSFNEQLRQSFAQLPSLVEKLQFLDNCYDELLKSPQYKRRHPKVDQFFAFAKNPLTQSQCKHTQRLKEEMQQVIVQHIQAQNFTPSDLQNFHWLIKNRQSALLAANTWRFYPHLVSGYWSKIGRFFSLPSPQQRNNGRIFPEMKLTSSSKLPDPL